MHTEPEPLLSLMARVCTAPPERVPTIVVELTLAAMEVGRQRGLSEGRAEKPNRLRREDFTDFERRQIYRDYQEELAKAKARGFQRMPPGSVSALMEKHSASRTAIQEIGRGRLSTGGLRVLSEVG